MHTVASIAVFNRAIVQTRQFLSVDGMLEKTKQRVILLSKIILCWYFARNNDVFLMRNYLKNNIAIIKNNIAIVKHNIVIVKNNIAIIKNNIAIIKNNIVIVKNNIAIVKNNIAIVKTISQLYKILSQLYIFC